MQRVSVVGNSGSGKSTLARELARRLDAPYVELDALFHQPGWTPLPAEDFRARVAALVSGERWVVDGNYATVLSLVWDRADTVAWLDPPRPLVMARIVRRTLRRMLRREELWNGNREQWTNLFSRDADLNIVLWAWRNHERFRQRVLTAQADPGRAGLTFVRLRTRADVAAMIGQAGSG